MPDSQSRKGDSQSGAPAASEFSRENSSEPAVRGTNGFVNHRSGFDSQGRLSGETQGLSGGTAPAETVRTVSPEERLFVALSRRGEREIGDFLHDALCLRNHSRLRCPLYFLSDDTLVGLCEQEVSAERKP